MEVPLAVF